MTVKRQEIEEALVDALRFQGCKIETFKGTRFLLIARKYPDDDVEDHEMIPLDQVAADIERTLS